MESEGSLLCSQILAIGLHVSQPNPIFPIVPYLPKFPLMLFYALCQGLPSGLSPLTLPIKTL